VYVLDGYQLLGEILLGNQCFAVLEEH
jgi:hypothetical protein